MQEPVVQDMFNMATNTMHELYSMYDVVGVICAASDHPDAPPDTIAGNVEFLLRSKTCKQVFADKDCEIFDFARRFHTQLQWKPYNFINGYLTVLVLCNSGVVAGEQMIERIPNPKTLFTLIRFGDKRTNKQQE